ncbi:hypothetical protein [Micromonospora sp. NPDC050495]|uniref:hypothetical protein n=1 Tax=Micromonospora sp. NPDC050495 TaxID=3154936 RepID=UPI0033FFE7B4
MKFVIDSPADGRYAFAVLTDDGQLLAQGRQFGDKSAVLGVVADMMRELGGAAVEDLTEATHPPHAPASAEVPRRDEPDMADLGRSGIPPV